STSIRAFVPTRSTGSCTASLLPCSCGPSTVSGSRHTGSASGPPRSGLPAEVVALERGLMDVHRRAAGAAAGAEHLDGDPAAEDDGGEDDELADERGQGGDERGEQQQTAADGEEPDASEGDVHRRAG